jgi:hypothetical protein
VSHWDEGLCECITPCASDADCADGEACLCEEAQTWITRCLPADCRTDADCGGYECGVSTDECYEANRLACRTADDVCHGFAQCEDGYLCGDLGDSWGCILSADCE